MKFILGTEIDRKGGGSYEGDRYKRNCDTCGKEGDKKGNVKEWKCSANQEIQECGRVGSTKDLPLKNPLIPSSRTTAFAQSQIPLYSFT